MLKFPGSLKEYIHLIVYTLLPNESVYLQNAYAEALTSHVIVFGDSEPVLHRVKKPILKLCLRGLTETGD